MEENVWNEYYILMELDHPNIIKVIDCCDDTRQFCLIMELCTGGDVLNTVIENVRLTESAGR